MIRYGQIRSMDISNGYGIGVSIFFSGCDWGCKDCFNSELWDYNYGKEFNQETIKTIRILMNKPYITRLSVLGGDGLMPKNISATLELISIIKDLYPEKQVWIWTGYLFENIPNKEILKYADFIIDGQFEYEKKDLTLKFRGSSNQRIWKKDNNNNWYILEGGED